MSLLGLCGFLLALYIYRKKKGKKKLVCPLRSDCDTVIHSDYSRIAGIPIEVLGMTYYAFTGIVYSALFIFGFWSHTIGLVLLGIASCSALFSLYLVSLQIFVIKHWCAWCMTSALISLLILLASYLHFSLF